MIHVHISTQNVNTMIQMKLLKKLVYADVLSRLSSTENCTAFCMYNSMENWVLTCQ